MFEPKKERKSITKNQKIQCMLCNAANDASSIQIKK